MPPVVGLKVISFVRVHILLSVGEIVTMMLDCRGFMIKNGSQVWVITDVEGGGARFVVLERW